MVYIGFGTLRFQTFIGGLGMYPMRLVYMKMRESFCPRNCGNNYAWVKIKPINIYLYLYLPNALTEQSRWCSGETYVFEPLKYRIQSWLYPLLTTGQIPSLLWRLCFHLWSGDRVIFSHSGCESQSLVESLHRTLIINSWQRVAPFLTFWLSPFPKALLTSEK